ncbi:MAG: hypothetical protein WBS54_04285 [Acidobacteriota bacterium]
MRFRLLLAALLVACVAVLMLAQDRRVSLRSTCGPDCRPEASTIEVPAGMRAEAFRVDDLVEGACCTGGGTRRLAGFSIRRGSRTVLIYYMRPRGPVSDPVPLDALTLSPGRYEFRVVSAKGASAAISFDLAATMAVQNNSSSHL